MQLSGSFNAVKAADGTWDVHVTVESATMKHDRLVPTGLKSVGLAVGFAVQQISGAVGVN